VFKRTGADMLQKTNEKAAETLANTLIRKRENAN